jgi:hypothetical protein
MPYIDHDDADADIKNDATNLMSTDKYFYKVRRTIVDDSKTKWKNDGRTYYKVLTIGIYGSGQVGSRARNAVSGSKYNILVGSKEQDKLYAVALCTGENGNKSPIFMYYDSPEQYESHLLSRLDIENKSKWHMRKPTTTSATANN